MLNFAEQLKKLRAEKKLTQKDIASLLDVKQQTISQYENGTVVPKPDCLVKLAEILDVSIDFLLHGIDQIEETELSEDAKKLLKIYDSLPEDKKSISINLLRVLQEESRKIENE